MKNDDLLQRFGTLTTAHLADGCLRAGLPVRCGPNSLGAVVPGSRLAGRALPARHSGSVDVFLEAFEFASAGDVLVVDNDGRVDEACIGDLVVLEARAAGLAGLVVWGLHRDTADISEIGLPVFSLGAIPTGPLAAKPRPADALSVAHVGTWMIGAGDIVFADDDGVLFVAADRLDEVVNFAEHIRDTEKRQAELIRSGVSLREQVQFADYLAARERDTGWTFRQHLTSVGGAIEV